MTEQEWLVCQDVSALLAGAGERKQRLCGCACVRRVWDLLGEPSRGAVTALEQYADGNWPLDATEQAFTKALEPLRAGVSDRAASRAAHAAYWLRPVGPDLFRENLRAVVLYCAQARNYTSRRISQKADTARQCDLLRHLLGNPFRPYPSPASWPTLVVDLARQLYDGADVRLILHDALLDGGHAELAGHFRAEEWHPKGCWVLDWVLNRK